MLFLSRMCSNTSQGCPVRLSLGVQRMTRKPKGKQDEQGPIGKRMAHAPKPGFIGAFWPRPGARPGNIRVTSPNGLARSPSKYHRIAHRRSVSACGHTHPDNRPTQAGFVCQCCGHTENADFNASKVIRRRGANLIVCGQYREKASQKTMCMANRQSHTVGADRSSRDESQKLVETSVRHPVSHGQMLGSQKQEGMAVRPAEIPATSRGF